MDLNGVKWLSRDRVLYSIKSNNIFVAIHLTAEIASERERQSAKITERVTPKQSRHFSIYTQTAYKFVLMIADCNRQRRHR